MNPLGKHLFGTSGKCRNGRFQLCPRLGQLDPGRKGACRKQCFSGCFRHFSRFRRPYPTLLTELAGISGSWPAGLARMARIQGSGAGSEGHQGPGMARIQGPRASQEALGRWKSPISGPWAPGAQAPGALDPIQHLPRIDLDEPGRPGSTDRRYGNITGDVALEGNITHSRNGPLSPGARSSATGPPVVTALPVRVGCGVYPGYSGSGVYQKTVWVRSRP